MKLFVLFALVILASCKSPELAVKAPSCVENKIKAAMKEPVQNPPLEVWEWKDNSTTYYYFTAPCCDQYSILYDVNCNNVCAPDGGFTGKGDGKCPEFSGEIQKTLIWKDNRTQKEN